MGEFGPISIQSRGYGMSRLLCRRKASVMSAIGLATVLLGGVPGGHAQTGPTFALVVGVRGDPFYVTMQKGAQAEADKLGAQLIVDGDYENGPVTFPLSYIGSDNVQGGQIACEALIAASGGSGTFYIQNVKPGISTTDQREQGCKQAIEGSPDATLVS